MSEAEKIPDTVTAAAWRARHEPPGPKRYACACGRRFRSPNSLGSHTGKQPVGSVCRPHAGEAQAQLDRRHARARRRRAERRYGQAWRKAHPGYHAAWAREHPEVERARRRRWRKAHPGQVAAAAGRRRAAHRAEVELPAPFLGHELFEVARAVVAAAGIKADHHLRLVHDTRWEEACAEAVLALVEGRDPAEAVSAWQARETGWARRHAQPDDWFTRDRLT